MDSSASTRSTSVVKSSWSWLFIPSDNYNPSASNSWSRYFVKQEILVPSPLDPFIMDEKDNSGYGKVTNLSKDTYQRWKTELRAVLKAKDLWSIASTAAAVQEPKGTGSRDSYNKYLMADAKAQSIIFKTLDDITFNHVRDCETSKQIMDRIIKLHEPKSSDVMMYELTEFFKVEWKLDDDVSSFLSNLVVIQGRINNSAVDGKPVVTDVFIIGKTLTSLPPSFSSFVESWYLNGKPNATLDEFRDKCLLAERNQIRGEENSCFNGDALAIRGTRKNDRRKRIKCSYCGRVGHPEKDCWDKKDDKRDGSSDGSESSDTGDRARSGAEARGGHPRKRSQEEEEVIEALKCFSAS